MSGGQDREIARGIVQNPHRCGGTPTIKGTRITAWMVGALQMGDDPVDPLMILEDYPSLTYADLVNARRWAEREERRSVDPASPSPEENDDG